MQAVVQTLRDTPALGGRVYPVITPTDKRVYPLLVWARSGGVQRDMNQGSVAYPSLRLDVVDTDYDRAVETLADVVNRLRLSRLLEFEPDLPDDSWAEQLGAIMTGIEIVYRI